MKKSLWIALPLLIAAGVISGAGRRLQLVNSDTLYLVTFYRDLFVDRIPLRGYNLGPAPFLFPDLPLLSVCLALCGEVGAAFTLYALLTLAAITGAMLLIAREIDPEDFPRGAAALLLSALLLSALLQSARYRLAAFYLLLPSNHGGALIAGLFLCYFALHYRERAPLWYWPTLFTYALLCAFSDLFFVAQFALPLCAAIALFAALRHYPLKTAAPALLTLGAASLLAKYLLHKLDKLELFNIPDAKLRSAAAAWSAQWDDMLHLVRVNPEAALSFLLWLGLTLFVLIRLRGSIFAVWRAKECGRDASPFGDYTERAPGAESADALLFLTVFTALSVGASAALPILAGLWGDLQNIRYLLPLYVLPPFMLALLTVRLTREHGSAFSRALFAGVALLTAVYLTPGFTGFRPAQLALPRRPALAPLLAYCKEHGLKYGWANYWYARTISLQAEYQLCLSEIHPTIQMNNWMNNPNRYFGPPAKLQGREWPEYNFILVNDLDRERIEQYFGPPAAREKFAAGGDELEIYVYKRRKDVALRNFLRMPAQVRGRRPFAARPALYADLYKPLPNYSGIEDNASYPVPPGMGITIDFDGALSGDVLELAADADDAYQARFYFRRRLIAELHVPPAAGALMQKRFLFLPPAAAHRPLDRVVLLPANEKYPHVLGHLFIYRDSRPQ